MKKITATIAAVFTIGLAFSVSASAQETARPGVAGTLRVQAAPQVEKATRQRQACTEGKKGAACPNGFPGDMFSQDKKKFPGDMFSNDRKKFPGDMFDPKR